MVVAIKSPNSNDREAKTRETLLEGREMALYVHDWMESHQEEYEAVRDYVRSLQGRKGRLRDQVAVYCVHNKIRVSESPSHGYMFDNSLWAGVTRYMALENPSLIGAPIQFRRSVIDCWGLYPVSWLGGQNAHN